MMVPGYGAGIWVCPSQVVYLRSSVRLDGRTRGWKAGLLDEGGFGFAWMGGVRGGLDGRGLEGDELCGMEGKEKIRCFRCKCVGSKLSAQTDLVAQA